MKVSRVMRLMSPTTKLPTRRLYYFINYKYIAISLYYVLLHAPVPLYLTKYASSSNKMENFFHVPIHTTQSRVECWC